MLLLKTEQGEILAKLDKQRISIGRDAANDVVLEDASVSGFHAVIFNDQGVVSVADLDSTNGTAVDSKRVRERTELAAWSSLQLGGVKLQAADSEGRQPTRVQPIVAANDRPDRRGPAARPTRVKRASQGATRIVGAAQADGAIRFESSEQMRAARSARGPSAPSSAKPTAVQNPSPGTESASGHALFRGYPRGLVWLLFSFKGRIRRTLFWKCFGVGLLAGWIPHLLTASALWELGSAQYSYGISASFYWLLMIWPWLAIIAKRIHDSGERAFVWCGLWAFTGVLGVVAYWLQAYRAAQGSMGIFGLLSLLVLLPTLYALYLAGIKRGDDGNNVFGDQNPHAGIVFRPWGTRN